MANNIQRTLLAKDQYAKHHNIIPHLDTPWWLKTDAPNNTYLCGVNQNDSRKILYYSPKCSYVGVRPVLTMSINSFKTFHVGNSIIIGSKTFTVLKATANALQTDLLLLCNDNIATRKFDPKSTNWETSELKD